VDLSSSLCKRLPEGIMITIMVIYPLIAWWIFPIHSTVDCTITHVSHYQRVSHINHH
jgi:hypothetical protein